jgi:hypothetical protein
MSAMLLRFSFGQTDEFLFQHCTTARKCREQDRAAYSHGTGSRIDGDVLEKAEGDIDSILQLSQSSCEAMATTSSEEWYAEFRGKFRLSNRSTLTPGVRAISGIIQFSAHHFPLLVSQRKCTLVHRV